MYVPVLTCFISESDSSPSQDIGRSIRSFCTSFDLDFLLLIVTPKWQKEKSWKR